MGGRGSGRRAKPKEPKNPRPKTKPCEYCGALMYNGNRPGRAKKYCSLKCKQAAYRERLMKAKA